MNTIEESNYTNTSWLTVSKARNLPIIWRWWSNTRDGNEFKKEHSYLIDRHYRYAISHFSEISELSFGSVENPALWRVGTLENLNRHFRSRLVRCDTGSDFAYLTMENLAGWNFKSNQCWISDFLLNAVVFFYWLYSIYH